MHCKVSAIGRNRDKLARFGGNVAIIFHGVFIVFHINCCCSLVLHLFVEGHWSYRHADIGLYALVKHLDIPSQRQVWTMGSGGMFGGRAPLSQHSHPATPRSNIHTKSCLKSFLIDAGVPEIAQKNQPNTHLSILAYTDPPNRRV